MGMRVALVCGMAVLTAACVPAPPASQAGERRAGYRIVSIDYCADQMLLGLVPRNRIAAVSVDAASDTLFAGRHAGGLPRVRAEVERILALRPTLVVRSYGGGPRIEAMLERAGVPVFTLPYANDVATVRDGIVAAGEALSAQAMAQTRVASFDRAIARARTSAGPSGRALYMTPGDVTTGPGGLIADLLGQAGYRPFEARSGWHRLPVERMVSDKPDLVVRAFFDNAVHQQDRWSSSGHAVLAGALRDVPSVSVPGATLACGNWLAGDALTAIAGARQ